MLLYNHSAISTLKIFSDLASTICANKFHKFTNLCLKKFLLIFQWVVYKNFHINIMYSNIPRPIMTSKDQPFCFHLGGQLHIYANHIATIHSLNSLKLPWRHYASSLQVTVLIQRFLLSANFEILYLVPIFKSLLFIMNCWGNHSSLWYPTSCWPTERPFFQFPVSCLSIILQSCPYFTANLLWFNFAHSSLMWDLNIP